MKSNRFLPLLFGLMLILLSVIAQAQEDDIYFDPETDEIVGYNDEYSEDEYVDEEYQYVDEDAGTEVRRIRRFRRTFNFVVVFSDPWLYYDDWGWTCRPRFRYRPYRCWRYNRWARNWHYGHHYYRHQHYGFHYGNYHWNHWVNHGYHPNYNGHWGYHHPHHHPWFYRQGKTNSGGRSSKAGIAAGKGARDIRPSQSTLAMNNQGGRSDKSGKQVISVGKPKDLNNGRNTTTKSPTSTIPSRPNDSGSLAQKPTSGNQISIGTNTRPTQSNSAPPRTDKMGRDKTTSNSSNPKSIDTPRNNKPTQSQKPKSATRPKSSTKTTPSRSPKTKTSTRSSKSKYKSSAPPRSSRTQSSPSRSSSRSKSPSRSSSSRSSSRSSSSNRSSSPRKRY